MQVTNALRYAELSARYLAANGRTPSDDGLSFGGDPATQDQADFFGKVFSQPPQKTIDMFKAKDIVATWNWNDLEKTAHDQAFTSAKVVSADVLQMLRDSIDTAQEEGQTFEAWKETVTEQLKSRGWYGPNDVVDPATGKTSTVDLSAGSRLRNIYDTNMQSAYMNSRYDQMKQAADRRPYMQYIAVVDERTTSTCAGLDGVVVDLLGSEVRNPPLHYMCRTRTRSLGEREMNRFGLSKSGPEIYAQYPPAPGFNSPPGVPWTPDLSKYDSDIAKILQSTLKVK